MNKFEKPLYTVYPRIYCSGIVLVNDVPVLEYFGKETKGHGGRSGAADINHVLLQSGKYKVVGKMYPRDNNKTLTEKEYMSIDFDCAEADLDKWKKSQIQFHPKIESPWDGLSEGINYPSFEIGTEIDVELPFVLDGWQRSLNLAELKEEEVFKDVLAFYRQLHAVLAEHNTAKFLELSKEKMRLQEQAFYFSEERKKSFRESAAALFGRNLEPEPLNERELRLQFMGYGRLARLVKPDGSQPLQFKSPNPEEQSNVEFDVKLHMRSRAKGLSVI